MRGACACAWAWTSVMPSVRGACAWAWTCMHIGEEGHVNVHVAPPAPPTPPKHHLLRVLRDQVLRSFPLLPRLHQLVLQLPPRLRVRVLPREVQLLLQGSFLLSQLLALPRKRSLGLRLRLRLRLRPRRRLRRFQLLRHLSRGGSSALGLLLWPLLTEPTEPLLNRLQPAALLPGGGHVVGTADGGALDVGKFRQCRHFGAHGTLLTGKCLRRLRLRLLSPLT